MDREKQQNETSEQETVRTAEDGERKNRLTVLGHSFREVKELGYYSFSSLARQHLRPVGKAVGLVRIGGHTVRVYDIRSTEPVPEEEQVLTRCKVCGGVTDSATGVCHRCAQVIRSKEEMDQYEAEKARASRMDPERMVFLDLEMTGDVKADEILSVSMIDGNGDVLLNSLVRPRKARRWPFTEKIHHITPRMVAKAPTLEDLSDRIAEILANAEEIIGYSVSNDWRYLKEIPQVAAQEETLRGKVRCCQVFYDRLIRHDFPALENGKRSLSNAMAVLGLDWDARKHSSLGDTIATLKVWRRIFLEREMIRIPEPETAEEGPGDGGEEGNMGDA